MADEPTTPVVQLEMTDDDYAAFIRDAIKQSQQAEQRMAINYASISRRMKMASSALDAWAEANPAIRLEVFFVSAYLSAFCNQRDPHGLVQP